MLPASRWMRQVREHLMPITCGVGFPGRSRWPRTARLSSPCAQLSLWPWGSRPLPSPCPLGVERGVWGSHLLQVEKQPRATGGGSSVMGMGTGDVPGDTPLCDRPHHGWSTRPCWGSAPPGHNHRGSSHRAWTSAAVKWVQAVVLAQRLFGALHVSTALGCHRPGCP